MNKVRNLPHFSGQLLALFGLVASISSDITIVGNGSIIERSGAAPAFRLLHLAASGALTLDGVTLRGGQTDVASFPSASGAAIFNNRGVLTIRNSHITLNTSIGSGAGIYNYSGTLLLARSTLSQNTAAGDGGGLQNDAGPAPAVATIENSTFAANVAGGGGGTILTARRKIPNRGRRISCAISC